MLGDISAASEIYLVCGYTDMRKSIDGLRAIVEGTLKLDSKNHSLFLFCGRRCDRIKALIWEGDGYVLLYKRLDVENGRYRWPRDKSEARNLTWQHSSSTGSCPALILSSQPPSESSAHVSPKTLENAHFSRKVFLENRQTPKGFFALMSNSNSEKSRVGGDDCGCQRTRFADA